MNDLIRDFFMYGFILWLLSLWKVKMRLNKSFKIISIIKTIIFKVRLTLTIVIVRSFFLFDIFLLIY